MIVRGKHFQNDKLYDFHLADGVITAISPADPNDTATVGGENYWVAPGLVDIQVNGYQGYDFCSGQTTPEDVLEMANRLLEAGVTGFCPTVTTNSQKRMAKSLQAIAQAYEKYPRVRERVLGIHVEGPYISPEDGPRGAHPLEHVRKPDWGEFCQLQDAAQGLIGLITVAPELPGAIEFIANATRNHLVVALGHHAASKDKISDAVAAGAVLSTHLGNGAHAQIARHPNYIWEQLANDDLMASIIVDGFHLPESVVKTIYRTKGADRLILVSDVVSVAGLPKGIYQFMGLDVEVRDDGSVGVPGTPYQAGSSLKLKDAIGKLIHFSGASFREAITMATANPARLLNASHQHGFLREGGPANLVLMGEAPQYDLFCTIAAGEISYQSSF